MTTWVASVTVIVVLLAACTSSGPTSNTYATSDGQLRYESDCPAVDPVLLSDPDGLPNVESTTLEAVEAYVAADPIYRVIPRNGWVWERASDGSVLVYQTEDFMLERTIDSVDNCPTTYFFPSGIPIAFVLED